MKKLLALLLSFMMVLTLVSAAVAEGADFTMTIEGGDVKENMVPVNGRQLLKVDVTLNGTVNDTLTALTFDLTFDPAQIAFVEMERNEEAFNSSVINDKEDGILRIALTSQGVKITRETAVVTLYFRVIQELEVGTEIAFELAEGAFAETYKDNASVVTAHDIAADFSPFVVGDESIPTYPTDDDNVIIFAPGETPSGDVVEVDGVPYPVTNGDFVVLPKGVTAYLITEYTYNKVSEDPHEVYPTHMSVWKVTETDGVKTANRIPEFDDILQYAGCSIRFTGEKGIRMITSIPKDKRSKLIKNGLAGFTLLEYGTVVGWDSELEDGLLTLDATGARQAYAYSKEHKTDPIYKDTGKLIQYTNVLVGLTNEKCVPDLAMRPYMIVKDAEGQEAVIYGGLIHRSIGFIAYQNRNAFDPVKQKDAYQYIWDIIHYVYGDKYDADYKL